MDETWKERYRAPVTYAWLSGSNPERGLAVSNRSGVMQLYAWEVRTNEFRQITQHPTGKSRGTIGADGRWIYYLEDTGGNELGHFVRVPFEGGTAEDITPDLPPYSNIFGLRVDRQDTLVGAIVAGIEHFQLLVIDQRPDGTLDVPRMVYTSAAFVAGPEFSASGEIAVIGSTHRSGKTEFSLVAIDSRTGSEIAELSDGPDTSIEDVRFARGTGDQRLAATTNRSGVKRPLIWNPRSGERSDLALEGLPGDVEPLDWSPDGSMLLLCHYLNAVQRLYIYDIDRAALTALQHPSGSYGTLFFAPDDKIWAQWNDSTHPPSLIALDRETGALKRTVVPPSPVPPSQKWRSVSFASSDGQSIHAWLATPSGDGPFPTILETPGGPQGAVPEMFAANSQAWLDRGYAFLTVNYRGSSTFGRDFEQKINGNLGYWEVEDMVAAREWLIAQRVAATDRILLAGWSYGGYLTMQALGLYPERWAGGMAGMTIADWTMLYEDSAETLRGYVEAIFDGTPDEKPEQYRRSSPITYVERVAAPLLIIQGRNDTRAPARPVELYERKMRELGKPIEVHWFEAGHGSYVVEQQIEHQELMMRWADRVLGRA